MTEETSETIFTKAEADEIQSILTRIHDRRLGYLYQGFSKQRNKFLIGNFVEDQFEFGKSELSCGYLEIKSEDHLNLIARFFKAFKIDIFDTTLRVLYLREIISVANASKWKIPRVLHAYEDPETGNYVTQSATGKSVKILSSPLRTYFTYIRLTEQASVLDKGLAAKKFALMNFDVEKYSKCDIVRIYADHDTFKGTTLEDTISSPLKFKISKGHELLTPAKVILKDDEEYTFGLRVWSPEGGNDICYGGYYEDARFSLISGRLNVFLLGNLSYKRYEEKIKQLKAKDATKNVK